MGYITTKDGVEIFIRIGGARMPSRSSSTMAGRSSDDWDAQMLFFLSKGYRVVAHDRRGHGRSAQVSDGHDMDHYAADAFAVVEALDLKNAVHIGHSTGGEKSPATLQNTASRPGASPRPFWFPPFRR